MRVAPVAAVALILLQGTSPQDDGQWTMPGKNYGATRYSGLAQITPRNAPRLRPVWTFSTGVLGGHEGQPLVVGSTMYVVTPFPDVLYAFDLTHEGYPLKWKYRPDVNPTSLGIACCDAMNRGAAAARRCGAGSPTTRSSTSSTSAPAIPARTTRNSVPARTSGPTASWPAGPATARWRGPTSSRRTTAGTTTPMPR